MTNDPRFGNGHQSDIDCVKYSWHSSLGVTHSSFHGRADRLDHDVLGLGLAQGEVVAADFDFQRVAERRGANKRDCGAGQHAHLAEAQEGVALLRIFPHDGAGADGEGGKRDGLGHKQNADGSDAAPNKLDHYVLGSAITERYARAAKLAKQRAITGYLLDDGGFAKPHLTKTLAKIRLAVQGAYATSRPHRKFGERHTRAGLAEFDGCHSKPYLTETQFQCQRRDRIKIHYLLPEITRVGERIVRLGLLGPAEKQCRHAHGGIKRDSANA